MLNSDGILQAATTISKTTQTLIGSEISCSGYDFITLFFTYTKGDETGLIITPSVMNTSGGTAYPYAEWSSAAGAKTLTASTFLLSATTSGYIVLDVRGINYIKFTQGGSNNDGTPTGTLAAYYTLKG
jgi:hypothetical protein